VKAKKLHVHSCSRIFMHSCCSGPQISIIYNNRQHQGELLVDEVAFTRSQRTRGLTSGSLDSVSTLPTIFGQLDNLKKIIRDIRAHPTVGTEGPGEVDTNNNPTRPVSPQMCHLAQYSSDGDQILDILNELNCVNDHLQQLLQRV